MLAERVLNRVGDYALIGVVLLSILIDFTLHYHLRVLPMGWDQGLWSAIAMGFTSGKSVFYRDVLHFSLPGPGIAYMFSMFFFENSMSAIVFLSALTTAFTIIVLFLLLRELGQPLAGAVAGFIFGVMWPLSVTWWTISQKDFLAFPWSLLATWLTVRAFYGTTSKVKPLMLFLSGSSVAISAFFKPPYGILVVIICLIWAAETVIRIVRSPKGHSCLQTKARELLKTVIWIALGVTTVFAPFLLYLAINGALYDGYFSITKIAPLYGSVFRHDFNEMLGFFWEFTWPGAMYLGRGNTLLGIAGFGIVLLSFNSKKTWWLLLPTAVAAFVFFMQGKGFPYHAAPWIMIMAMLAGVAAGRLWIATFRSMQADKAPFWGLLPLSLLSMILIYSSVQSAWNSQRWQDTLRLSAGEWDRHAYLRKYYSRRRAWRNPSQNEAVAKWIGDHSNANDKIVVWGFDSEIYALSKRSFATQAPCDLFLTARFIGKTFPEWQQLQQKKFVDQLLLEKPKFFVVRKGDATWLERIPSDTQLKDIPIIFNAFKQFYEKVHRIDRFTIYQIKADTS